MPKQSRAADDGGSLSQAAGAGLHALQPTRDARQAARDEAQQRKREEKERREAAKRGKMLAGGKQALQEVAVAFDSDAWREEYRNKLAMAGIPDANLRRASNTVSASIAFTQTVHRIHPSGDLQSTTEAVPLIVLIITRHMASSLGAAGMRAFTAAALQSHPGKVLVIFEGCGGGSGSQPLERSCREAVNCAVSPNLAGAKYLATPVRTGDFLASLVGYIAKAPYRAHTTEGKVFSEKTAGGVMRRFLSYVPQLGAGGVAAVTSVYPTLSQLLHTYRRMLDSAEDDHCDDPKLLLEDLDLVVAAAPAPLSQSQSGGAVPQTGSLSQPAGGGGGGGVARRLGPAASLSVYEAMVLGCLSSSVPPPAGQSISSQSMSQSMSQSL